MFTETNFFPGEPRPEVQNFVTKFRARYNEEPDTFNAVAYDTIVLLAPVIDKFGTDRTAIRDGLAKIKDVPSVIFGKATFDPETRRVAGARAVYLVVKDGKFAPWDGVEAAQPTEVQTCAFIDYTVNGLVIGNVYALLAVGLALIFGVANLINFAHGSVYTIGAYVGWAAITFLHTPLPVTIVIVALACGALGALIERVALRPLQGRARIAPLLATIGLSFVLDQLVQLIASPNPRALPVDLPDWRIAVGGGSIGPMDLLIAGVGLAQRRAALRLPALHQARLRRARDRAGSRRGAADGRQRRRASTARCSPSPRRSAASAACWSACITTTSTPR